MYPHGRAACKGCILKYVVAPFLRVVSNATDLITSTGGQAKNNLGFSIVCFDIDSLGMYVT
jgi:hypothetical protein